jgi:hypothetical protein
MLSFANGIEVATEATAWLLAHQMGFWLTAYHFLVLRTTSRRNLLSELFQVTVVPGNQDKEGSWSVGW